MYTYTHILLYTGTYTQIRRYIHTYIDMRKYLCGRATVLLAATTEIEGAIPSNRETDHALGLRIILDDIHSFMNFEERICNVVQECAD